MFDDRACVPPMTYSRGEWKRSIAAARLVFLREKMAADRRVSHDHEEWRDARSVADLAALTARWLEGELCCQPGCSPHTGPDPETTALVPVLSSLNRAGWLTYSSQPGLLSQIPGQGMREQRAAVHGITARSDLVDVVKRAAAAFGLIVITRPIRRRLRFHFASRGCAVTRRGGRPTTWFGSPMLRDDVATWLDGCHPAAVSASMGAVHLAVIDAVWGRDTVLWPCLSAAAAIVGIGSSGRDTCHAERVR
jgi:hypothetical protein